MNHERDWIYLTKDLGLRMTLGEFDSLSRKRISRLIKIMEAKTQREAEMREQQMKDAERKARKVNKNRKP